MSWRETLACSLSAGIRQQLLAMPREKADRLTEIRIRIHQPVCWVFADGRQSLGQWVAAQEMEALLGALCRHSRYAYEAQMAKGYIPLEHGHRAGVCGQVSYEGERIARMTDVTSVCIRIARRIPDASKALRGQLFAHGRPARVLLLGPPGSGKTTILRDAAMYLAGECALRVAAADEREELFSAEEGAALDVLRGAQKADAVELLLRTMSPQVIVCDELGRGQDADAMMDAVCAGVGVLASAHASCFEDAVQRPALRMLIQNCAFDRYVLLAPVGRCAAVLDDQGKEIKA